MDYEEESVSSLDHVSVIYNLCIVVTRAMKNSRHKNCSVFSYYIF
jgi:hypothetical protein